MRGLGVILAAIVALAAAPSCGAGSGDDGSGGRAGDDDAGGSKAKAYFGSGGQPLCGP
jgi:hypothetical protein